MLRRRQPLPVCLPASHRTLTPDSSSSAGLTGPSKRGDAAEERSPRRGDALHSEIIVLQKRSRKASLWKMTVASDVPWCEEDRQSKGRRQSPAARCRLGQGVSPRSPRLSILVMPRLATSCRVCARLPPAHEAGASSRETHEICSHEICCWSRRPVPGSAGGCGRITK